MIFFPHKPTATSLPDNPEYPARVKYRFRLLEAQLSRQISRLQPYKAPGEDGIPNVVLKQTSELIIPYLIQIFRAVFKLGTYSDSWCSWNTIVLHKLGKPRYDTPNAHQPITLMNMIGKLLSAIVAEDITYMCERYGLLPDMHFGGRPGKNTSDVMHFLTNRIKGAWRQHRVAAVLFLDIEGAFLNAVMERLLHNMHIRQLPESYVSFIENMLTNRRTKLRFDGFTSNWVNVENSIVQGDPLSMLLYLFYNADLIVSPKKEEAMIAGGTRRSMKEDQDKHVTTETNNSSASLEL